MVEESRGKMVKAGEGKPHPGNWLSVSGKGERALMPYGTLQGLKRSSTSTQAAERLEAYTGLHPALLP